MIRNIGKMLPSAPMLSRYQFTSLYNIEIANYLSKNLPDLV